MEKKPAAVVKAVKSLSAGPFTVTEVHNGNDGPFGWHVQRVGGKALQIADRDQLNCLIAVLQATERELPRSG